MNYTDIKQIAKDQGISVKDLCALAPNNDPFYVGQKSQLAAAEWFADLWHQYCDGTNVWQGIHLRRLHYWLVSQDPPRQKPNGDVYQNTEKDWAYLCNAGKWSRYIGSVSPQAFVDRRNPDAVKFADWHRYGGDPEPGYEADETWDADEYELPNLPELDELPEYIPSSPEFDVRGYRNLFQGYHIELWVEKSTMNDVLTPICRKYNANLVTGAGEMSITSVVDFIKRVRSSERPARILYISDFDPAGLGMPISVARKIEFFQRQNGDGELDIRLQPVVLTSEQVAEYGLPRVPVKDKDLRKANWEKDHGEGQVELDALEALHPGALADIVTDAILNYYDPTLQDRADETRQELEETLGDECAEVTGRYQDQLDKLDNDYYALVGDFDATREKFNELVAVFQPEIDAHQKRLDEIKERADELFTSIGGELQSVDLDLDEDYPLPETELPDESNSLLYISGRDYFDQLAAYKQHRHGTNGIRA